MPVLKGKSINVKEHCCGAVIFHLVQQSRDRDSEMYPDAGLPIGAIGAVPSLAPRLIASSCILPLVLLGSHALIHWSEVAEWFCRVDIHVLAT